MLRNRIQNIYGHRPQATGYRLKNFLIKIFACSLWFLAYSLLFNSSYLLSQEEFKYDSKGMRNPFVPLITADGRLLQLDKNKGKAEIQLEGIIFDKYGLSYAIVNSQIVKVGDFVGDKQVLKIEKNKIIFVKEGRVSELELKEEK